MRSALAIVSVLMIISGSVLIGYTLASYRQPVQIPTNHMLHGDCNDTLCLGYKNFTYTYGVAHIGEDYFCVWTKDRSIIETLDTCAHEWAHTSQGLVHPVE